METKTFKVPNMTCNGCVATVKGELEGISGVVAVEVNKPAQLVTVEWNTPASWETIEKTLVEIEYPPVAAEQSA
jgi:copper chaperone